MYVITGASGNTGKVIANGLLDAGKKVRVISRDAEHIKDLTDRGAEAAMGNLEDVEFPYEDAKKAMMEGWGVTENVADSYMEFMQTVNAGYLFEGAKRTEKNTTQTSVEDFAQVFAHIYNS